LPYIDDTAIFSCKFFWLFCYLGIKPSAHLKENKWLK
jgi:hypothetical protein